MAAIALSNSTHDGRGGVAMILSGIVYALLMFGLFIKLWSEARLARTIAQGTTSSSGNIVSPFARLQTRRRRQQTIES